MAINDSGMDFPKPADFDEEKTRRGPRVTAERLLVLGLLVFGGLFLGLAAEFWPDSNPLAGLLGEVRQVVQNDPKDDLRDSIIQKFRGGDIEQALLLTEKLIEIDPATGYNLRAQIHEAQDEHDKALEDCAKLIEVDAKQGHALRGKFLFDRKEYDKAAEDFTKLIEADPKLAEGYQLRVACRIQAGKLDEALADAAEVVKIDPVLGYTLEGQIHEEKKDYAKAVETYGKAIDADPGNLRWRLYRYNASLKKGDAELAVKDAEKIVELDEPVQGYILKGDALAKMGKTDEAIEAYGNALGHDPNNATALNNRAYHRALSKKDLVDAAKDIEEAIEIGGEQPAFIDTRGYISYLRGDFKQALADFNQSLRESEKQGDAPEFSAEIHFHRGLVYKQLGEAELAKKDFEKAKSLGFESKEFPEPVKSSL